MHYTSLERVGNRDKPVEDIYQCIGMTIQQIAALDKYGQKSALLIEQAGLHLPNVSNTGSSSLRFNQN